jgi:opacity protein-like surface antigen
MTKQIHAGRLAFFLLFLVLAVVTSAGQTPKSETFPTEPAKADPAKSASPEDTSEDSAKAVPQSPPSGKNFKRWGLSLHAGVSIPHGDFNRFFNPGPNVAVDLEYRITSTFSLEAIYGFHRFGEEAFGFVNQDGLNLHQLSFNGKLYGSSSPVRPFVNFGGGAYHFDPSSTHGGVNVGGGVQFDVSSTVAVEGSYNFHNVFTSGSSTTFSTAQGGVRFRF